jgi:hypothetical protein
VAVAVIIVAVLGLVALCLGIFVILAAPGDGQTMMVVLPVLLFAAALCLLAAVAAWLSRLPGGLTWTVTGLAVAAVLAWVAGMFLTFGPPPWYYFFP